MDDEFPVVDSRLCFVPSRGDTLPCSRTQQIYQWILSTPHSLHQCGLTSSTTFIVPAEMTTTLGEVHVHFIENSMTLDSLHWRMDATKLTLRNEMPPRTSPKLKQSEHIVCKISRRRKPSHDDHDSNQVLKLSMHLLEDL